MNFEELLAKAEKGDAEAQYQLGCCYYEGDGVEQNYEQAVYWWTKSAEQGNIDAQFNLGNCFYFGEGIEKNFKQAVNWYTKSAKHGDSYAQWYLGLCYKNGEGVGQNHKKAVYWFTKSAEQGNAYAQNSLGDCYYDGRGVEQNYEQAVYWFTKSAKQDNASAQNSLGFCCEIGRGVEQNYEQAVYWFTKSAEQGDADAQRSLGFCYENGQGVEKNYEQAVYWYTKSAEQDNATAQWFLGLCYEKGDGVKQSYEQAVYWFTKSAEQGDAYAQNSLGDCYYYGEGVEQNYEQAVYWYTKSAEQGNADAQFNLGICYDDGKGVEQNYEQAVYWYTKSAEQGNAIAQNSLGSSYYFGEGVEKNYEQAVYWCTKSAEQGNADAQFNLGICYDDGKGVEQNYERAVYWYTKSAEQGNKYAQKYLGELYEKGCDGVKGDIEQALKYYKLASDQGDEEAKEAYDRLLKENQRQLEQSLQIANNGNRYDMFVSWNHHDKAFKDKLVNAVENYNFDRTGKHDGKVFAHYRAWDSDREASGVITDCIQSVVNNIKFFVVILSRNSLQSNWVATESKMFLDRIDRGEISAENLFVIYVNEEGFDVGMELSADRKDLSSEEASRYEVFHRLSVYAGKYRSADSNDDELVHRLCDNIRETLEAEALDRYRSLQRELSPFAITLKNVSANRLVGIGASEVKTTLNYDNGYVDRMLITTSGEKSLEQIFAEGKNLYILGEGGTGKTLFISQLIRKHFCDNNFFVRFNFADSMTLSNFKQSKYLTDFANAELNRSLADDEYRSAEPMVRARNNGKNRIIYVFDGLDEISDDARRALCEMVEQYMRSQRGDRFIFTSRTDDVFGRLQSALGDLEKCQLRKFDRVDCEKLFDNIAQNATFNLPSDIMDNKDAQSRQNAQERQKQSLKKSFFEMLEMIEDDIKANPMLLSNLIFIHLYNRGRGAEADTVNKHSLLDLSVKIFLNDLEEDRRILDRFPNCKQFLKSGKLSDLLETVAYRKLCSAEDKHFEELIKEYYIDKAHSDKDSEDAKLLNSLTPEQIGKEIYDYLSSRGIITQEQITHDIFTSFFACRYVYKIIYRLRNDDIDYYIGWQEDQNTSLGKLNKLMTPRRLGSDNYMWQDVAVDLVMKLDYEIHGVTQEEMDEYNANYEVFDATLDRALRQRGYSNGAINTITHLTERKGGLYFAEFIRSYLS